MTNGSDKSGGTGWQAKQTYAMAAICLLLGVALGYLYRGSEGGPASSPATNTVHPSTGPTASTGGEAQATPTLEQMKEMGDKRAEPLLAKLKSDPRNAGLLIQIGHVYESVHQFKEAADYYGKSLEIDPKSAATRTEMASCLYYSGDVDGALGQLQLSLKDSPGDANSLFNLGLIRWKGKKDAAGALSAWQQLLKSNPTLEAGKKSEVERLIAEVKVQNTATPSTP
jgi:cytochrome c-type biogenesis protein CcmH/NrfG